MMMAILKTMNVARDRHYARQNDYGRIINIDTSKVTTTQFNLNSDDKDYLYRQGYKTTKQFLLNRWDWEQHLQARGYQPQRQEQDAVQPPALVERLVQERDRKQAVSV